MPNRPAFSNARGHAISILVRATEERVKRVHCAIDRHAEESGAQDLLAMPPGHVLPMTARARAATTNES